MEGAAQWRKKVSLLDLGLDHGRKGLIRVASLRSLACFLFTEKGGTVRTANLKNNIGHVLQIHVINLSQP